MSLIMSDKMKSIVRNLRICALLGLMMPLNACVMDLINTPPVTQATSSTSPVKPLPPLYGYSANFKARGGVELDTLNQSACARDVVATDPPCSALRRILSDNLTDRDGLRKLGAREQ